MPATPAWLASLESLLNRGIGQSMQASAAARELNRRSFEIEAAGLPCIRASVAGERLLLARGGGEPADASIAGSPWALIELLRSGGARGAAGAGSVEIRGDAQIAARFRELFAFARPDIEEELAALIGDFPARRLSEFARAGASWARKARRTVRENLAEYLVEESRDLVNKPELDEFLSGVDALRETADRAEARLARLEQRLKDAG